MPTTSSPGVHFWAPPRLIFSERAPRYNQGGREGGGERGADPAGRPDGSWSGTREPRGAGCRLRFMAYARAARASDRAPVTRAPVLARWLAAVRALVVTRRLPFLLRVLCVLCAWGWGRLHRCGGAASVLSVVIRIPYMTVRASDTRSTLLGPAQIYLLGAGSTHLWAVSGWGSSRGPARRAR